MKSFGLIGLVVLLALIGCSGVSDPESERPSAAAADLPAAVESGVPYELVIDPADFMGAVDNPYFPLVPGSRWELRGSGEAEGEVDVITVLDDTRVVMGVECVVVRDEVSQDGEPVEITDDWYAQDAAGNVWYFGEETAEYDNGEVVSTAGSWEAGVDGAQPGIIMPANPTIGVTYRQEFYAGEAEDMAKVVEVDQQVEVAAGAFDEVLITEDWTPLEPDVRERKSYAPGVGLIAELQIVGGDSAFELVDYELAEGG